MTTRKPTNWRLTYDHPDATRIRIVDAGDLDQIVVGDWLHLEKMSPAGWFLQVGDAMLNISINRKGEATVHIQRGEFGETRGETAT